MSNQSSEVFQHDGVTQEEKLEALITASLRGLVSAFQQIEIELNPSEPGLQVPVYVHPPYMLQNVSLVLDIQNFRKLEERHQTRLLKVKAAREGADEPTKALLKDWLYDGNAKERSLAGGRAELAEIRGLLQAAIDRQIIPVSRDRKSPTGCDLRKWLKQYGIGIDCSGFVQQLLVKVYTTLKEEGSCESVPEIGFLRCGWAYRSVVGNDGDSRVTFREVKTPSQARPGDILINRHHMRLVVAIKRAGNGGSLFELAESTSAEDVPRGQNIEEDDIGPRFIQVLYPQPDQAISRQSPQKKRMVDRNLKVDALEKSYVIGRHRVLCELWQHG